MKHYPLLLAMALLVSCSQPQPETVQPEEATARVEVATAQERLHSSALQFSGTVFANREANLGTSLPGKVEKIFFQEGEFVREGSLIVELSDEMLTQALIEYETLRRDYERVSRLHQQGSISEMDYDHIKARLLASQAKTEMVRKNTRIHAPFSGVLVERMMEEGEVFFLNPGLDPGYSMRSGVVRLMQLDPVSVRFEVNERELHRVVAGLNVTIAPSAFEGKKITGRIGSIMPMLSTMSRSATAEVTIANPQNMLKPGMFASVTVHLSEQKHVFIPLSSIYRMPGTGKDFAFVVRDSRVHRVPVKRITTDGGLVAVQGLSAGEQVITEGKTRVTEGQLVEIVH